MMSFEELSTESLKDQAEREKAAKNAAQQAKTGQSKPRFDAKTIADAHKHANKIRETTERKKKQPVIVEKIVKLERYYSSFGSILKSRKPRFNPDTVSESELDVFIETVEHELNSQNSDRLTETVWLLGLKGIEVIAEVLVPKEDLDLTSRVRLSDLAAQDTWMKRVKGNLSHLQIKYSLFEAPPEVSLVVSLISMVRETNKINQYGEGPESGAYDGRFEKL